MLCKCCRASVEEDMACCPICGFTLLGNMAAAPAVLEEYRKKRLGDISISVRFYYYRYNRDGELEEEKNEYVKVADALALTDGKVLWFGGLFDATAVRRSITLDVSIDRGATASRAQLTAQNKGELSCGRLGVRLDGGFRARLVVGDESRYIVTNSIALLPANAKT